MTIPRILVADSSSFIRERIAAALQTQFGQVDLRQAETMAHVSTDVEAFRPHAVLFDARMAETSLVDFIQETKKTAPDSHLVVLTWDTEHYETPCRDAGAWDLVDKTDIDSMVASVSAALSGRIRPRTQRVSAPTERPFR